MARALPPRLEKVLMWAREKREVLEWTTSAKGQPQLQDVVVWDLCERERSQ